MKTYGKAKQKTANIPTEQPIFDYHTADKIKQNLAKGVWGEGFALEKGKRYYIVRITFGVPENNSMKLKSYHKKQSFFRLPPTHRNRLGRSKSVPTGYTYLVFCRIFLIEPQVFGVPIRIVLGRFAEI